jgi:hypothetical protein
MLGRAKLRALVAPQTKLGVAQNPLTPEEQEEQDSAAAAAAPAGMEPAAGATMEDLSADDFELGAGDLEQGRTLGAECRRGQQAAGARAAVWDSEDLSAGGGCVDCPPGRADHDQVRQLSTWTQCVL